jgi:hypothetical protein
MVTSDNPRIFFCRCKTTWSNLGERRQECPACHRRCWDERPLPKTVRFVAAMKEAPPEPPDYDYRHDERSGYCLDEEWNDPNVTHISGYPQKSH